VKVAPSIIAGDFSHYQQEILKIENAGADLIHLDIMDGVFVPNLTFGPMIVEAIAKVATLELDAHLMIVNPEQYLESFIAAGADWISFHCEATDRTPDCIKFIKKSKKKAGLALSPETPFDRVEPYLERLDYLLVMSVKPGFYGQKFMPEALKKIAAAKAAVVRHRYPCLIQVDGGIYVENVRPVRDAGADIVVAGAGIFKTSNYRKAITGLKCLKG
jgi:ribulose-phosphate 3-epimerase